MRTEAPFRAPSLSRREVEEGKKVSKSETRKVQVGLGEN